VVKGGTNARAIHNKYIWNEKKKKQRNERVLQTNESELNIHGVNTARHFGEYNGIDQDQRNRGWATEEAIRTEKQSGERTNTNHVCC